MSHFAKEPPHAHGTPPKIGILLINLGSPDAATPGAVRTWLREFLSDPYVVEIPRPVWWLILNLFVLTTRPGASARRYAQVWTREGSPLQVHTERQATMLRGYLGERLKQPHAVEYAMRYGRPSIREKLEALKAQGCDRILLVPLYPHYAAATTATACDHAFRALMKMRWQPSVRVAPGWHDDPVYIDALASSVSAHLATAGFEPERLIATFHGMPQAYLERGDPYHCQCQKTSRLLRERLGWPQQRWITTFQSRFGRDPWLQPYTDATVARLAKEGVKRLALVAPGFTSDCLETLEELDVENRELFMHNGGAQFTYVPALNDSACGMRVIEHVVRRELMGWV